MARNIKEYKSMDDYVIVRRLLPMNQFLSIARERRDRKECVRCGHHYNEDEDMDWYGHYDHRTGEFLGDWCENCIVETSPEDEVEFFAIGRNLEFDFDEIFA